MAVPVAASAQLFVDGFDTVASSAAWNVQTTGETDITFGWDYSALSIPAARAGFGTTGVRMAANMSTGAISGLSMTPIGVVAMPANYTVKFDMWMNANGPFPGGGTGSTELSTFGIGASGTEVQWSGAGGKTFAGANEGGTTSDYRLYGTGTLAGPASNSTAYYTTAFPGQTAPAQQQVDYPQQGANALADGTLGFAWREVAIDVTGATATWTIDGTLFATVTDFDGSGSVFLGHYDAFASVSDNPDLSFVVYDNFSVIPEPSTYALFTGVAILGLAVWHRRRKSVG